MPLCEAVTNIRWMYRITGSQMAKSMGYSPGFWSFIEQGKRKFTVPMLEGVARILDCKPSQLAEYAERASRLSPRGRVLLWANILEGRC